MERYANRAQICSAYHELHQCGLAGKSNVFVMSFTLDPTQGNDVKITSYHYYISSTALSYYMEY